MCATPSGDQSRDQKDKDHDPQELEMLSELTQAMIVNSTVLFAVMESDRGADRKIGTFRILRPALVTASIVPLFIDPVVTHGAGLAVEVGAGLLGLLGGLVALSLMKVYRSPKTGKAVSRTGFGYAALWTTVIGARAAFSYGAVNWFPHQLATWCIDHQVSGAAITDGLVFMAAAMTLTRTLGMARRALSLPGTPAPAPRLAAASS
jgi:hypothetical protein